MGCSAFYSVFVCVVAVYSVVWSLLFWQLTSQPQASPHFLLSKCHVGYMVAVVIDAAILALILGMKEAWQLAASYPS